MVVLIVTGEIPGPILHCGRCHTLDTGALDGDRGILIFAVQLTTSRIGNLTRLIHTLLLYFMTIHAMSSKP